MKRKRIAIKKKQSPSFDLGRRHKSTPSEKGTEWLSLLRNGKTIVRHVRPSRGPVRTTQTTVPQRLPKNADQDMLSAMADLAYLTKRNGNRATPGQSVRVADLFSSCGFMSLGASEACHSLGKRFRSVLAVECNEAALNVYKENFSPDKAKQMDIRKGLSGQLGATR